jgi:WD40 repeat protein
MRHDNILTCSVNSSLYILNATDLSTLKTYNEHTNRAWSLALSPNNVVASGSFDKNN